MKKWIKVIACVLVCVLVSSLVQIGGIENVEASQKSNAMKAYKEFLTKNSWQDGEAYFSGNYFGLKDINGDKIPELIIVSGKNKSGERGYTIVAYNADYDEAEYIYNSWICDDCYFNASKKCLIDIGVGGSDAIIKTAFKYTQDGEVKYLADIYVENGKTYRATINEKKASKKKVLAKFDSYLKGAKLLKTPYKITKKNIKKYLK